MEVLAYILADPLPVFTDPGFDAATRILFGSRKTNQGDEELLQLFSDILFGLNQGKRLLESLIALIIMIIAYVEETFDALRKELPFHWYDGHPYDTINPFGDARQSQYRSLWIFDTQKDLLHHINRSHRSQMPLSLLRVRLVSMADMELLGGPVPTPLTMETELDLGASYWKPSFEIDERLRAFGHRLLRDFDHQWRHILRNNYNSTTLRVFANAIIRISTLDFEIKENTGGHGPRGVHVWITQLPSWEPLKTEIARIGNVYIVLCQEIQEGLSTAKRHLSSLDLKTVDAAKSAANYMVLSVKHIMLCRASSPTSLVNTAPEPLFNGRYCSESPSDLALDYLIWATASTRPLIVTPLQSLPVEVQDMVLNYVSVGTVDAAKVGCLLGIGTPFLWRDDSLRITLEERHVIRPSGSSVESQVWFSEHKSGVVYLAREG